MGFDEVTFDSAGNGVRSVGDKGGELFVEGGGYFEGIGEVSVVECNGLVGGLGLFFPSEGFEDVPKV